MSTADDLTITMLQQWRRNLLALQQCPSVKFTREDGNTREMDKKAVVRQISYLSRTIQYRRKQR